MNRCDKTVISFVLGLLCQPLACQPGDDGTTKTSFEHEDDAGGTVTGGIATTAAPETSESATTGGDTGGDPVTSGGETTTSGGSEPATSTTSAGETSSSSDTALDDTSAHDSSTTGADLPGEEGQPCSLSESGPITTSRAGQVIENVRVTSTSGTAITVQHDEVVIRNVQVLHQGGPGIRITSASRVHIEGVDIVHTGAPASGQNSDAGLINIDGYNADNLTVTRTRLTRGSSGIYLLQSPDARLSFLEGYDFRGPFPRGQLVQFNNSPGGWVEDFSTINPPETSWPEDVINFYISSDGIVRRGLIDGNNSSNGVAVQIEDGSEHVLVEDVDAVRQSCGCFYAYEGNYNTFRRVRCGDHICTPQPPRNVPPASNGLMFGANFTEFGAHDNRIEDSRYSGPLCSGGLIWDMNAYSLIELTEEDFTARQPIELHMCWE